MKSLTLLDTLQKINNNNNNNIIIIISSSSSSSSSSSIVLAEPLFLPSSWVLSMSTFSMFFPHVISLTLWSRFLYGMVHVYWLKDTINCQTAPLLERMVKSCPFSGNIFHLVKSLNE